MKLKVRVLVFLVVLTLVSLSCDPLDSMLCTLTGGEMVPRDYLVGRPYDPFTRKDVRCDPNFNQADYDAWRSGEVDTSLADMLTDPDASPEEQQLDETIRGCLAPPDMYKAEFANQNDKGSNDSKKVCQGDFILRNLSKEQTLVFNYYRVWDNGAMQDEGWRSYGSIGPEQDSGTVLYFGTQTFPDGREKDTLETYTHLVAYYATPECSAVITKENEAIWALLGDDLYDPCQ